MNRDLLSTFAAVVIAAAAAFAQTPSQDQQAIAHAFAKVSYAHQLSTVHRLVLRSSIQKNKLSLEALEAGLKGEELSFTLSDFSSGPVAEISGVKLSDLASQPASGRNLFVVMATRSMRDGDGPTYTEFGADANWSGPSFLPESALAPSLVDALKADNSDHKTTYTRYVSATVTASYKGESATYRATYLLSEDGQARALDLVTADAVDRFFALDVYPATLVHTTEGESNAVKAWIKNNAIADQSCQTGKACFDSSGRVGVPAVDAQSFKESTSELNLNPPTPDHAG